MTHPKIAPLAATPIRANILIYGTSGSGKTYAAATAPGPVLFLDAEAGTMTARQVGRDDISVWSMTSASSIGAAYKYLRDNPEEFGTVVLDSLTELQRMIADGIRGNAPRLSLPQYGELKDKTEGLIRSFRDLPVHVIATCLEKTVAAEDGGIQARKPMLVGQAQDTVPQFFDVVAWLHAEEVVDEKTGEITTTRRLNVVSGPGWIAKDRSGRLGRFAPLDLREAMDQITMDKEADADDVPPGMEDK